MPDVLETGLVEGDVGAAESVVVGDGALVGAADGEDERWGERCCGAVDLLVVVYSGCGGGVVAVVYC